MPSGWTRWILEQFEFPFSRVFARELDAGNLNAKYDVLIFVDGAIPPATAPAGGRPRWWSRPDRPRRELTEADVPAEYHEQLGRMTVGENHSATARVRRSGRHDRRDRQLRRQPCRAFQAAGARPSGRGRQAAAAFQILRSRVGADREGGYQASGCRRHERADGLLLRQQSGVPDHRSEGVRAIASFDTDTPLHSGWAWGQQFLNGASSPPKRPSGRGRVLLYGPEILQRAQPHGTFKLLFNAIFIATS